MNGEVKISLKDYHKLLDNSGCSLAEYDQLKHKIKSYENEINELIASKTSLSNVYNKLVEENRDLKAKISYYKKTYE